MDTYNNTTLSDAHQLEAPTRRAVGIVLLIFTICFLLFYFYVLSLIVGYRLWRVNSFYMWFVSLAIGDIGVLIIYIYSTTTIVLQRHVMSSEVLWWVDSLNDFLVINCYIQHPSMALVRMLRIAFPFRSRNWFTNGKSLAHIGVAWLVALINVIIVDSYSGDDGYFNPEKMAWEMSDLKSYYEHGLNYYWAAINGICVLLSLLFYAICFLKLRESKRKSKSATNSRNGPVLSKAELNLIKVGFVLSVLFALDNVFWQIGQNEDVQAMRIWWLPILCTVTDICFYGLNSIMIASLSSDIHKKMFFQYLLVSSSETVPSST